RADVVVSLSYEDAAARSRGELDPTEALGTGRVHVRGDLSVLVAGQGILASAAGQMAELQANPSYCPGSPRSPGGDGPAAIVSNPSGRRRAGQRTGGPACPSQSTT